MPAKREFSYSYEDIAKLIGLSKNAVAQHVARKRFDPGDLQSVVTYLARYGTDGLKGQIIEAMIHRDIPENPGGRKKVTKSRRKKG